MRQPLIMLSSQQLGPSFQCSWYPIMGPCKQDTKQQETGAEFHYSRLLVVFTPELCISQKLVHVLGIYAMLSFVDVSGMELHQTHSK